MTKVEFIFAFISGFSTCAVVLGALWFLRECERARAFKAMRKDIESLRETDRWRLQVVASVYVRMQEFRLSFGGKVALPASATPKAERLEVNMQHFSQRSNRITTQLKGLPGSGGPCFFGGSNEQR